MGRREQVGIRRLKNEASRIVSEVEEGKTEYVVTKRGKPVAVLRPVTEADLREARSDQVADALARLRRTARRVAAAASGETAAAVVSRQRR